MQVPLPPTLPRRPRLLMRLSPLTPHPSPLTPHPSPLTPHPSPLTAGRSSVPACKTIPPRQSAGNSAGSHCSPAGASHLRAAHRDAAIARRIHLPRKDRQPPAASRELLPKAFVCNSCCRPCRFSRPAARAWARSARTSTTTTKFCECDGCGGREEHVCKRRKRTFTLSYQVNKHLMSQRVS
jgi:hypothetical protein